MTPHTPKKPDQKWLEHLTDNYTYDREKGQVFNNKMGKPALNINSPSYLKVGLWLNKTTKMLYTHHVVWFFEYGEWPTSCLDHRDGNKKNNYHTNLQQVTQRENIQLYYKSIKSSSKYLGVSWKNREKKWCSKLFIERLHKHLGYFHCEKEAARAYDRALVSIGLDPVNVKIMRNEKRLQKVMEFIND
jgi:hypothetical protein